MLNYENFAVSLARAVELFRTRPEAIREQKGALRTLVALAKLGAATVRLVDRSLSVDAVIIPTTLPGIKSLIVQMDLHGIGEIQIARNASPADLLAMLRALAADLSGNAHGEPAAERPDSTGGGSVRVLTARPERRGRRQPTVTQAFERAGLLEAAAGDERTAEDLTGRPTPQGSPLEWAIEELVLDPTHEDVSDRLTAVGALIEREVAARGVAAVIGPLTELMRVGDLLADGPPKRDYATTLKRLLGRRALEQLATRLSDPVHADAVARILVSRGDDATDVLLEVLVKAHDVEARRAAFGVLQQLPGGQSQVLRLLSHPEWYVARAVADLVGEVRLEPAVPRLGRLLEHADHRVRKSAAVALARIGTAATVEHLREALRKGDTEVRALVAGAVGGRHSGALTMPLVFAAEEEPDGEIQRQFYIALARIGSPGAVQALIKAAQPGGRFFRRRRPEVRMAAIDGLRIVGGAAAIRALEGLRTDSNRKVRQAAREALEDMDT